MVSRFLTALLVASAAFAQAPAPLTFEVATIKAAQPPTPQAMMAGKIKIGETIDAARADYGFVNMEFLIAKAYGVKAYQVSGPSWIQSERYDILAKLPAGATKEQVPDMLKALLAERFKLEIHHDNTKEHAVYALVAGKNGSKLKESAPEALASGDDAAPAAGGMRLSPGSDGRSMTVKGPQGNMKVSMGADGNMHMENSQMTIASFVEFISRFVDKPIIDETGLKAKYDIALDVSMSDMMNIARSAGIAVPGMGGGRGTTPAEASDPSGGSIFQTVQSLGLKLEPRKSALDMIVVDKGDKTPTEN